MNTVFTKTRNIRILNDTETCEIKIRAQKKIKIYINS